MDNIQKLQEEIISSLGYKIQMQLELLSLNFYIFDANYRQWKEYTLVIKRTENFMKLWGPKERQESNIVLSELTRLLLNFLGSATSLVSATRNSVPVWYKDTKFVREYFEKKDQIKLDVEAAFIEGLRNYAQHDRLPFLKGQFTINMEEKSIETQFYLDRDILLCGEWKAKGKDFLSKSGKEIYIENIVEDYYKKIHEFHKWIYAQIQEINSREIQITLLKQKELQRLVEEKFGL